LALLFPDVYALINWQREVIFLDKELQQILPNAENGRTYADKLNKAPERQLDAKKQLIRLLYQRGYTHQQLLELFRLIDWMITLPHNLDIEFKVLVDQIEEEQKMAYVTSVERIAMQEGWMKGQQEGELKGKLEGKLEMAVKMINRFNLSVKEAADEASVSVKDLIDYLNKHEQTKS
jgi:predicted transposase YdaD